MQWGKEFPQEENKGVLIIGKAVNSWQSDDQNVDNLFDDKNPNTLVDIVTESDPF